jgi:hypothetical protein
MNTIETLRGQLPTTDDLLHAVGLQYERTLSSTIAGLSIFAIGAMTGAALALLLAPSSGAALRRDVRERLQSWSRAASEQLGVPPADRERTEPA